jgi:hypothetical protein
MFHFSITYFQETDICKYFGYFSFPPHLNSTGPLTRAKTILYRLKAIDAKKKPMTHLRFRWKLVEELSVDRMTVRGSKKRGRPLSYNGAERLDGKQHFIYANENSNSKDCAVCSISKIKGGRRETVYYCATCSGKPGLNPGDCFELYHTKVNFKCQN